MTVFLQSTFLADENCIFFEWCWRKKKFPFIVAKLSRQFSFKDKSIAQDISSRIESLISSPHGFATEKEPSCLWCLVLLFFDSSAWLRSVLMMNLLRTSEPSESFSRLLIALHRRTQKKVYKNSDDVKISQKRCLKGFITSKTYDGFHRFWSSMRFLFHSHIRLSPLVIHVMCQFTNESISFVIVIGIRFCDLCEW